MWKLAEKVELDWKSKFDYIVVLTTEEERDCGRILVDLLYQSSSTPVLSITTPSIPAYVNEKTLVFACSSNGIDLELMNCIDESVNRGSTIVSVTAKGPVAQTVKKSGFPLLIIPNNLISFAANGYMFISMLVILMKFNIIEDLIIDIDDTLQSLERKLNSFALLSPIQENYPKQLAKSLEGKKILIIGASHTSEAISSHWCEKLVKAIGWTNVDMDVFPDLQIVDMKSGIISRSDSLLVLLFTTGEEHSSVRRKIQDFKTVLRRSGIEFEDVQIFGNSTISKFLYLLVLGDYVGKYLGLKKDQKSYSPNYN